MPHHNRPLARRLDFASLQLFAAVCEAGSIAGAAGREHIAASALSKRISQLEEALGTPLLIRNARGVEPTPAGDSLLHHARSLLFGVEKLQSDLDDYGSGQRGQVRVHANISAIVQFLPEDLASFGQANAGVRIDLEEHLSGDILRTVREGAADLGICHAGEAATGLQTKRYRHDRLALIAPIGHTLLTRPKIAFADALEFEHVGLHAGSSILLAMREAAARAGKTLRLRIHVTGLDAMCRMVENGLGLGLMPERAFDLLRGGVGQRLARVALDEQWAEREIKLVARDFSTLPAAARTLVAHLERQSRAGQGDAAGAISVLQSSSRMLAA